MANNRLDLRLPPSLKIALEVYATVLSESRGKPVSMTQAAKEILQQALSKTVNKMEAKQ